jgi:hypothetical protein
MGRKDTSPATETQFWDFMIDRHEITIARAQGLPRDEWTDDPIFKTYKFTNIFRELDRGTIALIRLLQGISLEDALFNIFWYRRFNREDLASIGPVRTITQLEDAIETRALRGYKMMTDAHLTVGRPGTPKWRSTLQDCRQYLDRSRDVILDIVTRDEWTQLEVFTELRNVWGCGGFISYEIVTDIAELAPSFGLQFPIDIMTWTNIGPGAKRGLERLCRLPSLDSMRRLLATAINPSTTPFQGTILHSCLPIMETSQVISDNDRKMRLSPEFAEAVEFPDLFPPIKLRTIEHSLCEFDKYERVRTGVGTPRKRFTPKKDLPRL